MEALLTRLLAVAASSLDDPWQILGQKSTVDTSIPAITDVGILLRNFIIGAGAIIFVAGLIAIILIRNNEKMYEEKKSTIIKAIVTVWVAASAVTIFNLITALTESIF